MKQTIPAGLLCAVLAGCTASSEGIVTHSLKSRVERSTKVAEVETGKVARDPVLEKCSNRHVLHLEGKRPSNEPGLEAKQEMDAVCREAFSRNEATKKN